jgi:hypothetical protein
MRQGPVRSQAPAVLVSRLVSLFLVVSWRLVSHWCLVSGILESEMTWWFPLGERGSSAVYRVHLAWNSPCEIDPSCVREIQAG